MPFSKSKLPAPLPCTSTRHTLLCRHSFTTRSPLPCAWNCARPLLFAPTPSWPRDLPRPQASLAPWQYTCAHCRAAADARLLDAFSLLETRLFTSAGAAKGRGRRCSGALSERSSQAWEVEDRPALSSHPAYMCFTLTPPPQHEPLEELDAVSLHDPVMPSEAIAALRDPLAGYKFYFAYRSPRSGKRRTAYVLVLASSVRDRLQRNGNGYEVRGTEGRVSVKEAQETVRNVVRGAKMARRERGMHRWEPRESNVHEQGEGMRRRKQITEKGAECSSRLNPIGERAARTVSETSSWLDRLDIEDDWTHKERKALWHDLFQQLNTSSPSFWSASSTSRQRRC